MSSKWGANTKSDPPPTVQLKPAVSTKQDLNNCTDDDDNFTAPIVKICGVDEPCSQDEHYEEINEPSTSNSIRNGKGVTEELLPSKKSVIDTDKKYSGLVSDREFTESDEDLEDESSLASSSSLQVDTSPVLAVWLNVFSNWNPVERLSAINHLIQYSEPSEVRQILRIIKPKFQGDFIVSLPKELALYVLSFLEPKDLLQAAQTCRYWRILCDDSLLWREKCRKIGIQRTSHPDENCISSCEPWKAAYLRLHNVEMNWRVQPIKPPRMLKGHEDHAITCLQFSSNKVVTGYDHNTLKVWSATTGKCLQTLVGHTGGVWSSQMSGKIVVSGSMDHTLRVWNADTGACLHTLYGHTSDVLCMHLCGGIVVSGSYDQTLRVWNIDSGECLNVIGHEVTVRCVQHNGKIVVSGAYDFMVRVWDLEQGELIHQLVGHTAPVTTLKLDGIHVVSGSFDTSIRVWDVQTGACKHTLLGHQSLTFAMKLRENLLFSGNADSTAKIWDMNTGQCLFTLSGPNKHLSEVTGLQLINKFVITSSHDGLVKLWDIATGKFVRNLVRLSNGGVVWRIRASETKLVCAVRCENGTEETNLLVFNFDSPKYYDGKKDASTCTSTGSSKPISHFIPYFLINFCLDCLQFYLTQIPF